MVSKNVYFYSSAKYRVPASYKSEAILVGLMSQHILGLIQKEAQRLMKFWYNNVNMYFNRRAYGMGHAGGPMRVKRPQLGKVKNNYIANSRQHTGQLRRSLTLRTINIYGAQLYARSVHAKTDNRDYIEILMHGAKGGGAYNPALDHRVNHGRWGGIPSTYWMSWQHRFMREIRNSETRIQIQIEAYVEKMQVLSKKQIKAAREGYKSREFDRVTTEDMKNMRIELGKSKYKINQGLEPMTEEYAYDETWEGMKAKYYAKQIDKNPLTAAIAQPAQLNEIIKRARRNNKRAR